MSFIEDGILIAVLCSNNPVVRAPVEGQGSPQLSLPELPVVASSSVSCSGQCWAAVSVLGTVLPWRPVPGLGVLLLPHTVHGGGWEP